MKQWSPEEDAVLAVAWQDGVSSRQISRRLGNRTPQAVRNRVIVLGLGKRPAVAPDSRPWSDRERADLRRMWGAGMAPKTIAQNLDRTAKSVLHERAVLGLPTRRNGSFNFALKILMDEAMYRHVTSRALGRGQNGSEYIRTLIRRDMG